MNINRNNYEEYFLLYTDRELSAGVRSEVEIFVQQNPDLEEEFIMVQQSVLKPDATILFENKDSLLRKEEFIDNNNYQEKFLLYTDNELNSHEIEETEKFVLANPSLQPEFFLFQKVTFEPDTSIVFPDKSGLYKKEDDTRKIPFGWRSMAAAVLLGLGLWTGISYLQKNKPKPYTAVKVSTPKENTPVTAKPSNRRFTTPLVERGKQNTQEQKIPGNRAVKSSTQLPQDVSVKNIPLNRGIPEVKPAELKNEETVAIIAPPEKAEIVQPKSNGLTPRTRTIEPNDKTITSSTTVQNNINIIPVSYIAEADEKNENYVFFNITAEEFRKSKIGNFLKKAKRAIVAKLPLKNGIKIGNVEIAKDEQN